MRLRYLQHVAVEGLAAIEPWARGKGFEIAASRLYAGEPLPRVSELDWLVVMGGPMNVYEDETYPWLVAEKRLIAEAIDTHRTVIGICLGAQLIADVLGSRVTRNRHTEIGWFDVELTAAARASGLFHESPARIPAFHWHGDSFEIPSGALHIASSAGCRNQIFQYRDRVLGLQCHLEETEASIEHLLGAFAHEMTPGPFVQSAEAIRARYGDLGPMNAHLFRIFDRLAEGTA